jgi:CheY-like chemotaxis protein
MSFVPQHVLLVEDNMIIALDTEDMFAQLGTQTVQATINVANALKAISERPPDFSLLDIQLGQQTSFEIARRLTELGLPFAFSTGYGNQIKLPAPFDQVPKLHKPYSLESLRALLDQFSG